MPLSDSFPELLLNTAGEQVFIARRKILYLKADGSYTEIHLLDGLQCRISKKLKQILELLDSELFVRVHHSYAINLTYLAGMRNGETTILTLENGAAIPLSKSRKADFLNIFKRL